MTQSNDDTKTIEPIAHIAEDGRIHLLADHLNETANLAAQFAAAFGASEWGYLAGLWHDLGKYSEEFQRMIRSAHGLAPKPAKVATKVNHSTAGALCAIESLGLAG